MAANIAIIMNKIILNLIVQNTFDTDTLGKWPCFGIHNCELFFKIFWGFWGEFGSIKMAEKMNGCQCDNYLNQL